MAGLRAVCILLAAASVTLIGIPLQWLALRTGSDWRKRIPHRYHRLMCRVFGIRLRIVGTPASGGVLMTVNHAGWLDILVLSAAAPVSFVAKEEVNGWFFFGLLARLQETVFVRREARAKVGEDRDAIRDRLLAGDAVAIFPEGTSTDGNRVRPFKSALLGAVELPLGEDASHHVVHPLVQPVTIAYAGWHGMPMGREDRPFFAWYGDMELVPHLWQAVTMGPIDVVVEFHSPLTVDQAGGRKQLAGVAQRLVQAGLVRALYLADTPSTEAADDDDFVDEMEAA